MSSRDYKPMCEGKKHLDLSVLLETLFKLQLQEASHYKKDKEMGQRNITTHGCNFYIEQILISLSTKTVHRIDLRIVMKPRYGIVF